MTACIRVAAGAALLLAPATASAQAYQCTAPSKLPRPHAEGPTAREPKRMMAIGGYTLAITWAPQSCHDRNDKESFECSGGNRFGFTLHGLWPDGEGKSWPQYCQPAAILPGTLLRRHLCATPSAQLLQHEYAKHGTCTGLAPRAYFVRSTRLYHRLHYPDMRALAGRDTLTAGGLAAAIAGANPGLSADMMRIRATAGGWLDEIWFCLDTRFHYRRCATPNAGLPPHTRIRVRAAR